MTDADAVPIREQLEPEEIRDYQVYLATKRQLATSSVIVALPRHSDPEERLADRARPADPH